MITPQRVSQINCQLNSILKEWIEVFYEKLPDGDYQARAEVTIKDGIPYLSFPYLVEPGQPGEPLTE